MNTVDLVGQFGGMGYTILDEPKATQEIQIFQIEFDHSAKRMLFAQMLDTPELCYEVLNCVRRALRGDPVFFVYVAFLDITYPLDLLYSPRVAQVKDGVTRGWCPSPEWVLKTKREVEKAIRRQVA
jgi:hypothetical protein